MKGTCKHTTHLGLNSESNGKLLKKGSEPCMPFLSFDYLYRGILALLRDWGFRGEQRGTFWWKSWQEDRNNVTKWK